MSQIGVVWFKRDLRITDHAPLKQASESGLVLPLYIIEPDYWCLPDVSWRHAHFIKDSLEHLHQELLGIGGKLTVRIGSALNIFKEIEIQYGSFTLWSHEETGNAWTYQRDKDVLAWCKSQSISWHEFQSHGVKRRLKTRDVWSSQRDAYMQSAIPNPPQGMTCVSAESSADWQRIFPQKPKDLSVQVGGRAEGLRVLQSFLDKRAADYMKTISKPGLSARHCSRLSSHIAYGTLSVREIEQETVSRIDVLRGSIYPQESYFVKNLEAFLSRLAWRCHFVQKLEQQPEIEQRCMHSAFEDARSSFFNPNYFEAWKNGVTGYPLIDAAMRSLHANGWITFRMRAMLVSFASYHLWLDWRVTAPYLAQLFTDYEPGIHYSQFQMQSGTTGINVVRMYNPIKQSYDHDADGKFIRRYVPELRDIPASLIHEPWRLDVQTKNYPVPIVEHKEAIRVAKSRLAECWKQKDFRAESNEIQKKLGSRSRPSSGRIGPTKKARKTVPPAQFELLLQD